MSGVRQAGRYLSVAVQSALSDWVVFTALVLVGAPELAAQGAGRAAGGVWSFLANKLWAFGSRDRTRFGGEALRFLVLYAFSYGLSLTLFAWLSEPIGPWVAKLVADTTCFGVNFVVMRAWVFAAPSGHVAQATDAQTEPPEQLG